MKTLGAKGPYYHLGRGKVLYFKQETGCAESDGVLSVWCPDFVILDIKVRNL